MGTKASPGGAFRKAVLPVKKEKGPPCHSEWAQRAEGFIDSHQYSAHLGWDRRLYTKRERAVSCVHSLTSQ